MHLAKTEFLYFLIAACAYCVWAGGTFGIYFGVGGLDCGSVPAMTSWGHDSAGLTFFWLAASLQSALTQTLLAGVLRGTARLAD